MLNGLPKLKKFKKLVLDILTLSYSNCRLITFLLILLLLFITPISLLEKIPKLSICSHVLGEYCYSVGITRGVASLLKGNASQAIEYNPLSVPVLLILLSIVVFDAVKIFLRKNITK